MGTIFFSNSPNINLHGLDLESERHDTDFPPFLPVVMFNLKDSSLSIFEISEHSKLFKFISLLLSILSKVI